MDPAYHPNVTQAEQFEFIKSKIGLGHLKVGEPFILNSEVYIVKGYNICSPTSPIVLELEATGKSFICSAMYIWRQHNANTEVMYSWCGCDKKKYSCTDDYKDGYVVRQRWCCHDCGRDFIPGADK